MRSYDRIFVDFFLFLVYYFCGGEFVINKASKLEIATYLTNVKKLLSAGKYVFVPRRKNMQALARHGLTITDAKEEILGLAVCDYGSVN